MISQHGAKVAPCATGRKASTSFSAPEGQGQGRPPTHDLEGAAGNDSEDLAAISAMPGNGRQRAING